ncbi:MAG TPA: 2-isopropylmalate synthase, partial [Bacteroidales bacterium]|nr:2-isopropylmalate synthase [Bacteroidales bacterium]
MYIEIMDTTLRDGEQTNGVSFTEKEKFSIAKQLLTEVKVNRIEIASARVSKGEFDSVQRIMEWARKNNFLHQIEVLGFIDNHESINWVHKAGGVCINLLCKGSLKQLTG